MHFSTSAFVVLLASVASASPTPQSPPPTGCQLTTKIGRFQVTATKGGRLLGLMDASVTGEGYLSAYLAGIDGPFGQPRPAMLMFNASSCTPNAGAIQYRPGLTVQYTLGAAVPQGVSPMLKSGSNGYALLTWANSETPAGASPQLNIPSRVPNSAGTETGIFDYDSKSEMITAKWINSDGAKSQTRIAFASNQWGENQILLTGDIAALQTTLSGWTVEEATIKFIPK